MRPEEVRAHLISPYKIMEPITMYSTTWCPDCWRAKSFLKKRGVEFREVNIEEDDAGEAIVIKANNGKRKVPTFDVGGRYFACSPFDAEQLAAELNVPLNP
jgi:mycoredoxin